MIIGVVNKQIKQGTLSGRGIFGYITLHNLRTACSPPVDACTTIYCRIASIRNRSRKPILCGFTALPLKPVVAV